MPRDASVLAAYKYALLLALLLVSLAFQSFDPRASSMGLLSDVFRTVLMAAIFLTVFERHRDRMWIATPLVAIVAIAWSRHVVAATAEHSLAVAFHGLLSLFLWAAVWVILRNLFQRKIVGAENVLGAICGYVIAGDAWGSINTLTYLLMPSAYSLGTPITTLVADWQGRIALFSYYGFTQMLTIGYADLTPVRAPATTLSLFGALFGVFYTAVVVSQFVGMAQAARRDTQ